MASAVIITLCALLLASYFFAVTSAKTRIPSVLMLLIMGWTLKQATLFLNIQLPRLDGVLPVLATIGLVLIVLEGTLELKLDRSKIGLISKSFFGALVPIIVLAALLAYAFHYFGGHSIRSSLINALPFCVISSSIAIPSAINLKAKDREFIIYESSFSDIIGVLIFNFVALNKTYHIGTFGNFGLQILLILVISLVATVALSYLLARIRHHVKFVPIILIVVLLFTVLKIYHLPGLIFILLFGLFVGHMDQLKDVSIMSRLLTYDPKAEVQMFTVLTAEGTFLIRSLFFIVFGYLLETSELFNPTTMLWASGMVAAFFIVRALQLKLSGLSLGSLLFLAPRGLITILLFLYITPDQSIDLVNRSLIIQVIVLTVLLMTFGMMFTDDDEDEGTVEEQDKPQPDEETTEEQGLTI